MNDNLIEETVKRYIREYDRYKKLADIVFNICQNIVQKNLTIRATVQHRAKSPSSLAEKLRKTTKYKSVDSVFAGISDLAGVRIITYQEADRPKVVEDIRRTFVGIENEEIRIEVKDKNGSNGKYYKATHCQVALPSEYLIDNFNLKNTTCEIQVCSLLSHVYNEIEHDLQYKPRTGKLSNEEKLLIDQLGLITKSGDITIRRLLEATNERLKKQKGEFVDVHDFTIRMGELVKVGESFSKNAGLLYDEFVNLKLTSPETIFSTLLNKDENLLDVANTEFERLTEYIRENNLPVKIDKISSDLLLLVLLRRMVDPILKENPAIADNDRTSRLLKIANVYKEMISKQ
ncbi:MAG: RelA/SpoT domain-containing protein [Candidatus Azobacteroides sp.]|nr:RelA/SpoT domain-containing protein [Candidatus Azobacteroides sp.]